MKNVKTALFALSLTTLALTWVQQPVLAGGKDDIFANRLDGLRCAFQDPLYGPTEFQFWAGGSIQPGMVSIRRAALDWSFAPKKTKLLVHPTSQHALIARFNLPDDFNRPGTVQERTSYSLQLLKSVDGKTLQGRIVMERDSPIYPFGAAVECGRQFVTSEFNEEIMKN